MKKLLKTVGLLVALVLFTNSLFARTYYFSSSTGNDNYTSVQAQNPATPWQTLKKLQYYTTSGHTLFLPGDTIAFKRGDVFANGYNSYVSCFWWNTPNAPTYFTAPSGLPGRPIVITNWGSGPLPIFHHPNTTRTTNQANVFGFAGVSWIVIDGLRFEDLRMAASDKSEPCPTTSAIILGEYTKSAIVNGVLVPGSASDYSNRKYFVKNFEVKNCQFTNISFAFSSISAEDTKIHHNRITNLKSTIDTAGTYDVMAGAFESVNGDRLQITNNYVKGAWAKSGRISSTYGLGGVGLDMFTVRNSLIAYNTFIDCSGMFEIGSIDYLDSTAGCAYDTFAFNKVINCSNMGYVHTTSGSFVSSSRNLSIFNNTVINNTRSRQNGPSFGDDIYSDGQSFSQFWFFRGKTKCPNDAAPLTDTTWGNPINPSWCNYGGHRMSIQYASNSIRGGADTLIDSRNNIFYSTVGDQIIYDNTRTTYKHRNNIYYIKGGYRYPTTLGGSLGQGERIVNTKLFRDTSALNPEDWDLHLVDTSYGVTNGSLTGMSYDFDSTLIAGTQSIGMYQQYYTTPITPCQFTYGNWTQCSAGWQNRDYTANPIGCSGTPPRDSIIRACNDGINITYFYYSQSKKSIYIFCNVPGSMYVTNVLGTVVRTLNYRANGQWLNVSTLPTGTYFATTYGRSLTFIR
jgi:hypothetical protein